MSFPFSQKISISVMTMLFLLLVVVLFRLFFYHDCSDNPPPPIAEISQPTAVMQPMAESQHPTIQKRASAAIKPQQAPPVPTSLETLAEQYEAYVLKVTDAEHVRVESTSTDGRGYVAFMARPEGFERGIPSVMQELAQIYLDTYQDAPAITLSLVIGGGVKGQMTFLRDGDNTAILPEQRADLSME